ncbi:kunitz:Bovine pancreatic trypsin inhibitor [Trichuris trichiura]|uniref:Kunitz:Bovine pancreatic trypsin inhibitor n=1 Tax=Trichuris trichiura TaxID=36087 RepID=A0A077YXC4_TRITR|nr:kunitz:Bovine pancreatic trypsin inhibitor [Trichuris trichiura]
MKTALCVDECHRGSWLRTLIVILSFIYSVIACKKLSNTQADNPYDNSGEDSITSRSNSLYPEIRELEVAFNNENWEAEIKMPSRSNYWSTRELHNGNKNDSFSKVQDCYLPKEDGEGVVAMPRWFFNSETGNCEIFFYRGQGGNGNNFLTYEACDLVCQANPCIQPKDSGIGKLQVIRFYFNLYLRLCESFTWTGAGGNRNNFPTIHECRQRCPENPNPCNYGVPLMTDKDEPVSCGFSDWQQLQCPVNYFCHIGASEVTTVCCPKEGEVNRCQQAQLTGIGNELLLRWYFNQIDQTCRFFFYRGLKGNENNFFSKEECEHHCFGDPCTNNSHNTIKESRIKCTSDRDCPSQFYCHIGGSPSSTVCCTADVGDKCLLPVAEGHGDEQLTRWYYDPYVQSCRPFLYRGRRGNQNNFLNPLGCETTCSDNERVAPGKAICNLPLATGTGQVTTTRWYYDAGSGQCMPFQYGGMYGNQNNFITKEDCERNCLTFVNACPSGAPLLRGGRPQFCSSDAGSCPSGYWCHIGATMSTTMCCPGESRLACDLVHLPGFGTASITRYYFDRSSGHCKQFIYKGMYGNQNNFISKEQCERTCLTTPAYVNPCRTGMPLSLSGKVFLCSKTNLCPSGYYCHIGSTAQTTACCSAEVTDPCRQNVEAGEGNEELERWYYDNFYGHCDSFVYRGKKGNQNNFVSKLECEQACATANPCAPNEPVSDQTGRKIFCTAEGANCPVGYWCHVGANPQTTVCCPGDVAEACNLPMATGHGGSNLRRYYFNSRLKMCVLFTYGGLGGNQNNFISKDACESTCRDALKICANGLPAVGPAGERLQCSESESSACPAGYWCHFGASPKTTVCCPKDSPGSSACDATLSLGHGNAQLQRYYFDKSTRTCLPFVYTGLGGSENNFLTEKACNDICIGGIVENPCAEGFPATDIGGQRMTCTPDRPNCPPAYWCHFGYDDKTTVCCPGSNQNSHHFFSPSSTLDLKTACTMPMIQGEGKHNIERFAFDAQSGQCISFVYKGIKGNANNFLTQKRCQVFCIAEQLNPCSQGFPASDESGAVHHCGQYGISCRTGYWCHYGASRATTVCCPGASSSPCKLPLSFGSGNAQLQRFYFDVSSQKCLMFAYGGIKGNQNNFPSKEICEETCIGSVNPCPQGEPAISGFSGERLLCSPEKFDCPQGYWCHKGGIPKTSVCCPGAVSDPCMLPIEPGFGTESLLRYGYNGFSKQCQSFYFKGLKGNQNNFMTMQQCVAACQDSVSGNPCAQGNPEVDMQGKVIHCFATGSDSYCGQDHWCHIGAKIETSVCCPGRVDNPCQLPLAVGSGGHSLNRWYFNGQTNTCVAFFYGGTRGNQNNFLTQEECNQACIVGFKNPCPVGEPQKNLQGQVIRCSFDSGCDANHWCHLGATVSTTVCCPGTGAKSACNFFKADPGQGDQSLSRWFYDANSQQCLSFIYRGTKGNPNNFLTKDDCERICQPDKVSNPCPEGKPLTGPDGKAQPCNALTATSSCPSGYWCHVGATIGTTVCCQGSRDPCTLPMATGVGEDLLPRWYYEPNTERCVQFTYRGSKGNQNNFLSMEACRAACREFRNPCIGQPARTTVGQVVYCSATNKENCPVNFWCHIGDTAETTMCCPGATNPCSVPLSPGTGTSSLPRWYYNADTRICTPFTYNGIGGNQNNFLNKVSCEEACPGK